MILRILIKELGTIQSVDVSETLSHVLDRSGLTITPVSQTDLRIRNLPFAEDMYEMKLDEFRQLAEIAQHYDKMDKALNYYARHYSQALVHGVVGDIETDYIDAPIPIISGDGAVGDTLETPLQKVANLPKRVLSVLKHYFNEPFVVQNLRLSDEKHANVKYIDDSAEFRILFTVLDVAIPDEAGHYHYQPLDVDIFGRYDSQFSFDFAHAKIEQAKFFGYDDLMYDKRQTYFQMIFNACQTTDGVPLYQALEQVAQTFIYDFWLE